MPPDVGSRAGPFDIGSMVYVALIFVALIYLDDRPAILLVKRSCWQQMLRVSQIQSAFIIRWAKTSPLPSAVEIIIAPFRAEAIPQTANLKHSLNRTVAFDFTRPFPVGSNLKADPSV